MADTLARLRIGPAFGVAVLLVGSVCCGPTQSSIQDPSAPSDQAVEEMSEVKRRALSLPPDTEEGRLAWRAYRAEVLEKRLAAFPREGECEDAGALVDTLGDVAGNAIERIPSRKALRCGDDCGPTLDSLGWRHAPGAPLVDPRLLSVGQRLVACRLGRQLETFWSTLGKPDMTAVAGTSSALDLLRAPHQERRAGWAPLSREFAEAMITAARSRTVGCREAIRELKGFESDPVETHLDLARAFLQEELAIACDPKTRAGTRATVGCHEAMSELAGLESTPVETHVDLARAFLEEEFAIACDPKSKIAALTSDDPKQRLEACVVLKAARLQGVPEAALDEMVRLADFDDATEVGGLGGGTASSIDPPAPLAIPLLPVMVLQELSKNGGSSLRFPVREACSLPSGFKRSSPAKGTRARVEVVSAQAEETVDRLTLRFFGPPTQFVIRVKRDDRRVTCYATGGRRPHVNWEGRAQPANEALDLCPEWGDAVLTSDQFYVAGLSDEELFYMLPEGANKNQKHANGKPIVAGIAGHRKAELELPRSSPSGRAITIATVTMRGVDESNLVTVRLGPVPKSK